MHASGHIEVFADIPVSVRFVNRPHSEHDTYDARINEIITKLVAKMLPWRHRQVYHSEKPAATGLQETKDVYDLLRVRRNIEIVKKLGELKETLSQA